MGVAIDLFLDRDIDDEFICTICHDVLHDVTMIVACEHVFCKLCINQWMRTSRTCPIDRQVMRKFQPPQRSFMNLLGRLQLHCPHKDLGCTSIVNLCDLKEHEERCESSPENNREISCSNGCGVIMKKFQMRTHVCAGNNSLRRHDSENSGVNPPKRQRVSDVAEQLLRATTTPRVPRSRRIWSGNLEWCPRTIAGSAVQPTQRSVCSILAITNPETHEPEVSPLGWGSTISMHFIPKQIVGSLGGSFFRDVPTVQFIFHPSEQVEEMTRVMTNGFAGCIQLFGGSASPNKVCILLYSLDRLAFLGFIPTDQLAFIRKLRDVVAEQKALYRQSQSQSQSQASTQAAPTPSTSSAAMNTQVQLTQGQGVRVVLRQFFDIPMQSRNSIQSSIQTSPIPLPTRSEVSQNQRRVHFNLDQPQRSVPSSSSSGPISQAARSEADEIHRIVQQIEQLERTLASARRQQQRVQLQSTQIINLEANPSTSVNSRSQDYNQ